MVPERPSVPDLHQRLGHDGEYPENVITSVDPLAFRLLFRLTFDSHNGCSKS